LSNNKDNSLPQGEKCMISDIKARRDFLRISITMGAGLILSSCADGNKAPSNQEEKKEESEKKDKNQKVEKLLPLKI
jgi:hypothetical protein